FNFSATYLHGIGLSSGLFFTIYAIVNGGSRIGGGGLSDRFGRAVVIIPTLLLFTLGLMLDSVTRGNALMVTAALCIGLGFGMANPTILAQLLDRADRSEQGRIIGGFYFCYQIGTLCAAPLFGVVADALGYPAMWQLGGSIVLLGVLVYAWVEVRRGRASTAAAADSAG
ncbi:MAG TPA: MFS transporter, partial [bacterium]